MNGSSSTSSQTGASPQHVAIIMDGNGRWAKARGLPREEGHRKGVENVRRIVETAKEIDLRYLTLYAFSVENWNRPKREVNALMTLLDRFLKSEIKNLKEKQIRLKVIGDYKALPNKVVKRLESAIEETQDFRNWTLSLALNYGSRSEIIEAVKRFGRDVKSGEADPESLDWDTLQNYFYTHGIPDPDLIIRTSGEQRISNFLLLQSAYAEYYFAPEYWPDFGPDQFKQAIANYLQRERRFGRTGEQIQSV